MPLTTLTPPTYSRRETEATVDSLGRLYVHGNIVSSTGAAENVHSNAERYDPSTGAWTILPNPTKKIYQTAWILDSTDRVIETGQIVLNLTTGTAGSPPDSFLYDPASNTWTTLANSPFPSGQGAF